jgi:hypothetical protein
MLEPAAELPRRFCLGARDFDPEHVGFRVATATAFSAIRWRERRAQANI